MADLKPKLEAIPNNPSYDRWQAPHLRRVGKLTDIVQGGGKTGTNADADPTSTFKGGGG